MLLRAELHQCVRRQNIFIQVLPRKELIVFVHHQFWMTKPKRIYVPGFSPPITQGKVFYLNNISTQVSEEFAKFRSNTSWFSLYNDTVCY